MCATELFAKNGRKTAAVGSPACDLPYRQLVRRYGADLAYAPMLNSGMFIRDPKYRVRGPVSLPSIF